MWRDSLQVLTAFQRIGWGSDAPSLVANNARQCRSPACRRDLFATTIEERSCKLICSEMLGREDRETLSTRKKGTRGGGRKRRVLWKWKCWPIHSKERSFIVYHTVYGEGMQCWLVCFVFRCGSNLSPADHLTTCGDPLVRENDVGTVQPQLGALHRSPLSSQPPFDTKYFQHRKEMVGVLRLDVPNSYSRQFSPCSVPLLVPQGKYGIHHLARAKSLSFHKIFVKKYGSQAP